MRRRHATQAGMLYGRHSDVFPHPDEGVTVVATSDLATLESRAAELEAALRALVEVQYPCAHLLEGGRLCPSAGLWYFRDGATSWGSHLCDQHNPDRHGVQLPYAAPLRAALLLLAKGGAP